MDFLTVESGKNNKDSNILVVTDHFTKYSQAYVTSSQTGQVVAKTLWEKIFMHYGMPEKLLSDQGRNFEIKLVSELCALTNVKKLCTTPYHPQINEQCKSFNVTLIWMLGTLPRNAKQNWQEQVAALKHTYNCTQSNATGFSPYFLMFGHHPNPPIDIEFRGWTQDISGASTHKYIKKLQNRLKWVYKKA